MAFEVDEEGYTHLPNGMWLKLVEEPQPPIDWVKIKKEYEQRIIDANEEKKYRASGIYCIKIDNKIAYIGKSKNMITRVASHMINIENPKSSDYNAKKYHLIRAAKQEGHQIGFDVLFYCNESILTAVEGEYIRKYMPALNTQIPKVEGGWEVRKINNLTLPQLLSLLEQQEE